MVIRRYNDYILLVAAFFIYSLSSVLIKYASKYAITSMNYWLLYIMTVLVLAIYALVWQKVLKKFELFIAYSAKGLVIIFAFLWGIIFFNEAITVQNILGLLIIIIGIVVVNKNAS